MNNIFNIYHSDNYKLSVEAKDYKQACIHYLTLLERKQPLPKLHVEVKKLLGVYTREEALKCLSNMGITNSFELKRHFTLLEADTYMKNK